MTPMSVSLGHSKGKILLIKNMMEQTKFGFNFVKKKKKKIL